MPVGFSGCAGRHVVHDSGKHVYRKIEKIVDRRIAGESLLVPVRGHLADMQRIFSLNPVGEFVWERIDGRRAVREILVEVWDAFDVDRERSEADVAAFLNDLANNGLVEQVVDE